MSEVIKPPNKNFFRRYWGAIVVLLLGAAAIVALYHFTSAPIRVDPIWKGTGTVVSVHDVPASQVTHTECVGMKPMVCSDKVENIPESWALTVRVDSGEEQTFPITRGQFETLHPGDTFTRK